MLMFQPLRKYFDFNGRARRAEYWQFILFQFLVSFVLSFMAQLSGKGSPLNILSAIFTLAVLIPTYAVGVRRLHDTNRTGWWLLLPSAVFVVTSVLFIATQWTAMAEAYSTLPSAQYDGLGLIRGAFGAVGSFMTWVVLPTWLACLVTFIFHISPGTEGSNRFGPDPKNGSTVDIRVFDDERIDAAIAEAKGGKRERDPDYKPVFDFTSPIPATETDSPRSIAPVPVPVPQTRPTPTFGKRR